MGEFQDWQHRYDHGERPDRAIYAGVIAVGCTIGLPKMARIYLPSKTVDIFVDNGG